MPERRANTGESLADKTYQELIEFVGKAEFGTVEHQAVSDYLDLQKLSDLLEEDRSDREILQMETALLKHQIRYGKSRVDGYVGAYEYFSKGVDGLGEDAASDARDKFPGDDERQLDHIGSVLREFLVKAEYAVSGKRVMKSPPESGVTSSNRLLSTS